MTVILVEPVTHLCCVVLCSRLTQIFAVSQSYLYHAYAWLKLYNFSRTFNKNLTASDTQVGTNSKAFPVVMMH